MDEINEQQGTQDYDPDPIYMDDGDDDGLNIVLDDGRPAQDEEDNRHWYVVHCYSGYENKVQHAIEQRIESMGMQDRIFDVIIPDGRRNRS